MPVSGSISAAAVGFGPNNNEFTVDKTSGQVDFAIGAPTVTDAEVFPALRAPTYSTLPSTNISATTHQSDAVNALNNWLGTYILDSPPAPTFVSSGVDTQKIFVNFTLPPQKLVAFAASVIPAIDYMKADVILHASNGALNWSGATTYTLQTVSAGAFGTVVRLELYVEAGTSQLSGTTYLAKASVVAETAYDIRIYGTNKSTETSKYLQVLNLATLPVGAPIAPTGLGASAITSTTATATWTEPADHDVNTAGNQTTPYIARYAVDRSTTSSSRYGGVITDTTTAYTTLTTSSNSATTVGLTALNPGTLYSMVVSARNTLITTYGATSTPATTFTTSDPTAPIYLQTSDSSALSNVTTLRGTYSSSGGYTLDGTTLVAPVLSYTVMTTGGNDPITTSFVDRRSNVTIGSTSTMGTLSALGGPTTTYTDSTNTASTTVNGFGGASAAGTYTSSSASTKLVVSKDADYYTSPTNVTGFYKVTGGYAQAVATSFPASTSEYSLRLQYASAGGSTYQSTQVKFYVDDANTTSAISNLGIIGDNNAVAQISGVPTYTSSASFKVQFNQSEIAHRFLRYDKRHADLLVTTSGGTTIGSTFTIYSSSITGSHYYFVAPSPAYQTSSTKHNTNGTVLAASSSPQTIQFNTFSVPLTAASGIFDEAVVVKATPFSLYTNGGGTQVSGGYLNVSDGSSKTVRIDTKSISADRSNASFATSSSGQHVSSGTGSYPSTFGSAYDHTQSLLSNSDLQLVNGLYSTPALAAGYKNYTGVFCASLSGLDYSSISSGSSSYRYVTFKYGSVITSGTYNKINIVITHSGLTLDVAGATANHTCQLKMVDSGSTYTTGWMDCNSAVLGTGIGAGSDGTACADVSSTVGQRKAYILTGSGSTCVAYVRIGIPNNLSASVTSAVVTAVTTFP